MTNIVVQISENVTQSAAIVSPSGDSIAVNLSESIGAYDVAVTQSVEVRSINVVEALDQIAVSVDPLTPAITVNVSESGGGGGSDAHYMHSQDIASDTWTIAHFMGKYPSVTVVDSAGDECEGSVNHLSTTHTVVSFSAAFAGRAFLN